MEGTQLIDRATLVLKLISAGRLEGNRLSELVRRSGITQSTLHRILRGLAANGLVVFDAVSKEYALGPLCYELGLASVARHDFVAIATPFVEALANTTGDSVYCTLLSELDTVCVLRYQGSFAINTYVTEIGDRRPLGVGAGSIAILAAMPKSQADDIIAINAARYHSYAKLSAELVDSMVESCAARGYSMNEFGLTRGVTGLGVCVLSPAGDPIAGLGVTNLSSRVKGPRVASLANALAKTARAISKELGVVRQA